MSLSQRQRIISLTSDFGFLSDGIDLVRDRYDSEVALKGLVSRTALLSLLMTDDHRRCLDRSTTTVTCMLSLLHARKGISTRTISSIM